MKRIILSITALLIALSTWATSDLTLEQIVSGDFFPDEYTDIVPLQDGESFARLSDDSKQIVKCSFRTGQQTAVLFDANQAQGPRIKRVDGYQMSPDESRILIQTETQRVYRHSRKAQYYIYSIQNRKLEPLSQNGPQMSPLFSPDGNMIAFVRNNNLFLVKLLFNNSESQVTKDGELNAIINGIPDWVNEEEFSWARAFDFSADSKMLAWIKYDERRVKSFDFPLYKGLAPAKEQYATYPGRYTYKYPKAGEDNARVSVQSYDISSHVIRTLDVPMDSDGYIPRIKFTSTPDQLAIVTLNRHQNRMDILMGNARSRICRLALRLEDDRYVKEDAYQQLHFYGSHMAVLHDKSGSRQLYWYATTGQLEKQLTHAQGEVTKFYGYDAQSGNFYYQATDGTPTRTAIFRTNLKGQVKRLSAQPGDNDAVFSTGCRYMLLTHSDLKTPPVTSICDNDGRTQRVVLTNDQLNQQLADYRQPQKELFTFQTSEGVQLNGWMMKPANFDPNKRYPVVLYQYSGPGSQEVKDSWSSGFLPGGLLEGYLNSRGFIVVCVDGRGTGGRGADFEKCTYLHLGKLEAHDQVEAAQYLGRLPYVDASRIGIWGWSYGGFNTLMSMSQPEGVFKAGVAVAPPSDWRYYDTIYTERYMRTPQENDGYDYSPLGLAGKLQGNLLICHGLADDNVHFQNTAEYAEALVQQGKQFDMQVYTNRNHSIYGGKTRLHLLTRITRFFENNL